MTYSASAGAGAPRIPDPAASSDTRVGDWSTTQSDGWSDARSYSAGAYRADSDGWTQQRPDRPARNSGRGLAAPVAVAVLLAVAAGTGLLDYARGLSSGGLFGWGLALGSLLAIVLVRRAAMFPVVVAPPIVYIAGKLAASLLRHQDLASRKGLIDVATNWFVYGFPAMAAATAIVLLVAGIRLIIDR